ncbi:MAG: hypothetical protein IKT46_04175 [Clostridia bacterium]|nr:hypothetical protein [Clostridia bacterium]
MAVNYIITDALRLCAETVIPSVFPFMVLTNLLISCGFDSMVKRLIKRPFEAAFHLNGNLASAYILGIISGYPQGAYAIAEIYDKGGCTKKEAEHALAFCNNTGPAFAIAAVGSLWGNENTGISLFVLQCIITLLYGVITRPKKLSQKPEINKKAVVDFTVIPKAVTASVTPMLNICGFVVIFALLCSFVGLLPVPMYIKALVYSLLEISNGVRYICESVRYAPLLGFAVIWSGVSVHMQTAATVKGRFSMKKYYIGKVIQASGVFLIIYLKKLFF